eukprot:CAMPEP_0116822272 /NCGR_PEP_ID=MMETSP0418-20121206/177_1 /TAXON_ID=1158023 /ORGANISM="Astrosyne radiata, Strain 13vi08-1A" /LENGTH=123 /DNA_ID=CAMNT_0004450369 /DNA_START=257 /DNA_END=628 /DNA_ORIENTATION=+
MRNMGLTITPNQMQKQQPSESDKEQRDKRNNILIQMFAIPESDNLQKPKRLPLTQEDQEYIAKCMAKHGVDYTRMFRDIRTNDLQLTEQRLEKMGSRFLLLENDQRLVEVPDKVKHLVANPLT